MRDWEWTSPGGREVQIPRRYLPMSSVSPQYRQQSYRNWVRRVGKIMYNMDMVNGYCLVPMSQNKYNNANNNKRGPC